MRREKPYEPHCLLITGGCGFIGSNLVRHLLDHDSGLHIINLDALTYAGNPANLRDLDGHDRYRFIRGDIREAQQVEAVCSGQAVPDWPRPDSIAHLAAETHVDRSILGPLVFIETNVRGTVNLLEQARRWGLRFLQVSTDEVYGDLTPFDPPFQEGQALCPSSPYSASKASADHFVLSYCRTYGLDASIERASNNYGPYQFPEKLIPLMTIRALAGEALPVYGRGENVRDWIHVSDHCRAIHRALTHGRPGGIYHAGGGNEHRNIDIVRRIVALAGAREDQIAFVTDRPGHDIRYSLDHGLTTEELGWEPVCPFDDALEETVAWYRENQAWWGPILSGEYLAWIDQWYGGR